VHEDFVQAARRGQGAIRLEYLLSRGADVDARDESGLTPLYHAAFRGDNENVQVLLLHGADVNSEHHLLGTPIAVAALRGHLEVVEMLLLHRVDFLRFLPGVGSALHCACYGGNIDIFRSILRNTLRHDYLTSYRETNLKAFSIISATDHKPSGILRLLMKELDSQSPSIRCSPIFLAAERCNFDLLNLCWSEFHHDYFLLSLWDFPDVEEKAAKNDRPQRRIKASWASVESRSGRSYASKGSSSSAWSTLGFPLASMEHPQSTLLMWAAASLNLPLITHLLEAGASANATDGLGQTALHYAAAPLLEATFKDVRECVRLILADQASTSTKPSTRIAHKPPPTRSIKSPLELVVGKDHAALDPRMSFKWGRDIHQTCISSFLDPLATDNERSELAQTALLYALMHDMCPVDSIKLLCEHAVGPGGHLDSQTGSGGLDEALYHALKNSAAEVIILMLMDHGASPNAERYKLPLIMAIESQASEAVLTALLQCGADPDLRPKWGWPITPNECAKQGDRRDVIALFARHDTVSKSPDRTPIRSTGPGAAEASLHHVQGSRSPASLTVLGGLDDVNEADELEDLGENIVDKLKIQPVNEPKDSAGSSRLWFSAIPTFPLSRFRRNSKQR
jgi:ankyrin repeat protein